MTREDNSDYLYPDHAIGNEAIASREYELAASTVRANSVTLGALTALYAIASAAAGLVGLTNPTDLSNIFEQLAESDWYVRPSLLLVLIATSYSVAASLANARLDYVISARKIIIIRQLANVRFGLDNLILPSWRFEAARHPHAIRYFEGWRLRQLFPLAFSLAALNWIFALVLHTYSLPIVSCILIGLTVCLIFVAYYRAALFEDKENFLLLATYAVADILDLKLDSRRIYLLYRARLGVLEAERLNIQYAELKDMIVFREDRTFFRNFGISFRGIARAAFQTIVKRNLQGGSTISQQLFRSLYVIDYTKSFRRKIVESFGAIWIKSVFTNDEILELYICSVRYGPASYGLLSARRKLEVFSQYTGKVDAFLLAERVSNVGSNVRWKGIDASLSDAVNHGVLLDTECQNIREKYRELIRHGVLTESDKKSSVR